MWVSVEKPESEVIKRKVVERETKFSNLDMDEARGYLKRFRASNR